MNFNIPAAVPLAASLLTTSSMFFGNLGLSLVGPLPIIRERLGPSTLSTKSKVVVWANFFKRAAALIVGGTLISTTSSLLAAALTAHPQVRMLASLAAAFSISIIPYTLLAIQPTNNTLLGLAADPAPIETAAEKEKAEALIAKWETLHNVRYIGYGCAWALVLAALYVERPF